MENKKFWSRSGIILGIILVLVNVLLSAFAYNDPSIRHPEGFSDFKILAYPNALLGFPVSFISFPIHRLVSSHYEIRPYSRIPNDDLNNQNIAKSNSQALDNIYQTNLFIDLFILLSVYWFFVGTFLAWIYHKLSKTSKIFFIAILILIVGGEIYISIITVTPRPYSPQVEVDKMEQGKHQVPCIGIENQNPYAKCYEPN